MKVKDKKKLAIWIPFSSETAWTGEGITRTIEIVLKAILSDTDITCEIVCSQIHKIELKRNLREMGAPLMRLRFLTIPISQKKKRSSRLLRWLSKIVVAIFRKLHLSTLFNERGLLWLFCHIYQTLIGFRKDIGIVWAPVPGGPFAEANFRKKKVMNFWDNFPLEYYGYFKSSQTMKSALDSSDFLITQSQHNKDYLAFVYGIKSEKVSVLTNWDLQYRGMVSDINLIRLKEDRSQILSLWRGVEAGSVSARDHQNLRNKAILLRLIDELDAQTKIFIISTQFREYKGFENFFAFMRKFRLEVLPLKIKIVVTADLETFIVENKFRDPWMYSNIFQISRVADYNHALLYAISDLAVHPSLAEGGEGVFPLYEAGSMNTLTMIQNGRHTRALLQKCPQFQDLCIDFLDYEAAATQFRYFLENPHPYSQMLRLVHKQIDKYKKNSSAYALWFENILSGNQK